jgi:hypothetical protein
MCASKIATTPKCGKTYQVITAPKEVSLELLLSKCKPSANLPITSNTCYFLVLDVNGILCLAQHPKSRKRWRPWVLPRVCGHKLISF